MLDWWHGNLTLFSSLGLTKADFLAIVEESRLLFRHGLEELMNINDALKIPFFVVSGGISEIIQSHFELVFNNRDIESK